MTIEQRIKLIILERYKNMSNFSKVAHLPYGTIDSIFRRGFANSNLENVLTICKALGISADGLAEGNIISTDTSQHQQVNASMILEYVYSNEVQIDGVPLSDDELTLFTDVIELGIDLIRRRRP